MMVPIVEGKTLPRKDIAISADVVVIGSGAGGAVMATELAEAGLDVVVLEEGSNTTPDTYGKMRITESLRVLGREAGSSAAIPIGDTPMIGIMMGRTVGGSSTMTGGVCFRIPEVIADGWAKTEGLHDLAPDRMERHYERVEKAMSVEVVPVDMRSRATTLFDDGARKRGFALKSMRRNTSGCIGLSRCNFGCPRHAKLSVDLSYLPRARAKGARIWSDVLVDRVTHRSGRASGVVGRVLNGADGGRGSAFSVAARAVVVSAGTLHTPQILGRSGVGRLRRVLGRGLTLHPSFRVAAIFDEEVNGWDGAFQSAFSDHYEPEGITLNSAFPPLNVLAAAIPGIGRAYIDGVKQLGHLAVFGALVHDGPGGRLRRGPGREPWTFYKLAAEDRAKILRGMRIMSEIFFDVGAKQVLLPIFGQPALTSPDQLKLIEAGVPMKKIETISFHPLGSARMGIDDRRAIVSPTGETFDLPGLWVADGSIFPSSIGVNSQLPIMAMATRISENFLHSWTGSPAY